jgi:pyrimidine operon attenuation protein/uracil phosphoribosyltransferase
MSNRNYILTQSAVEQKLNRMVLELAENLSGHSAPLIIIGIRKNGLVIAEKTGALLKNYITNPIHIIAAELNKDYPTEVTLSEQIDFNGQQILLTDDVTNSGRTLLYALKPLLEYHPLSIETLVLVERMHKLFPVKINYVGLSVATTLQEHIHVEVKEGIVTGAYIE